MMPALVPYVGKDLTERPLGPLRFVLSLDDGREALRLFRRGLDTCDISQRMEATEAAVANAIARARDAAR